MCACSCYILHCTMVKYCPLVHLNCEEREKKRNKRKNYHNPLVAKAVMQKSDAQCLFTSIHNDSPFGMHSNSILQ